MQDEVGCRQAGRQAGSGLGAQWHGRGGGSHNKGAVGTGGGREGRDAEAVINSLAHRGSPCVPNDPSFAALPPSPLTRPIQSLEKF